MNMMNKKIIWGAVFVLLTIVSMKITVSAQTISSQKGITTAVPSYGQDAQSLIADGYKQLKLGDLDQTISLWKESARLAPGSETTRRLSQYIDPLLKESAKQGAQKAIQDEKTLSANLDPNTVAVYPFENQGSSQYESLSTGLAEMVITDLSQVKSLKVLERIRVQALLAELKLSQSGIVDQNSGPKTGKLLGAGKIAAGSFLNKGEKMLGMNLSMIKTQEGKVLSDKQAEGTLQEFYKLEKSLVVQALCGIGTCPESLDEATQAAVNHVHTKNFKAFLEFSKGLELQDKGKYREARQAFLRAIEADPRFRLAQKKLLETPLFSITIAVVLSEENNFLNNEKPIIEIPLEKPSPSTEVKEGEQEKKEKASASPQENRNTALLTQQRVDDFTFFPIEPPPETAIAPVNIKLNF